MIGLKSPLHWGGTHSTKFSPKLAVFAIIWQKDLFMASASMKPSLETSAYGVSHVGEKGVPENPTKQFWP